MTVTSHGAAAVAVDLDATLAHLDAVIGELGAPPADRDAVLWAAHELATCARLLVHSREVGDPDELGPAVDYTRSAMACLAIARRQEPAATDGWSAERP